ncbi:hypothetical protein [Bradyrhizobium sp. DOA1]|uniref:hypothetical protein n=1 Tax=Bradyrhizobium sp. DOA1 TaxID=1126616 RepID=UPI00077CCF92|nr:hypothetical protein [Bradyrhizobium sp. DOA1]KYH01491.1 hypothetical protein SE91_25845 [Bradyrhizobium sp. DOA1]
MLEQSGVHFYLNWAKERIEEMDAALGSFEIRAGKAKAEAEIKADRIVADLRKCRDKFQAELKAQAQAGEATWAHTKMDLERQWNTFETQMNAYFESAGKQIDQQQATFKDIAGAQARAWHEAADKFREAAGRVAASHAGEFEAGLEQMKADASTANARLATLKQAGGESWAALSAALAESRKAFDQANQAVWHALKGSGAKS